MPQAMILAASMCFCMFTGQETHWSSSGLTSRTGRGCLYLFIFLQYWDWTQGLHNRQYPQLFCCLFETRVLLSGWYFVILLPLSLLECWDYMCATILGSRDRLDEDSGFFWRAKLMWENARFYQVRRRGCRHKCPGLRQVLRWDWVPGLCDLGYSAKPNPPHLPSTAAFLRVPKPFLF